MRQNGQFDEEVHQILEFGDLLVVEPPLNLLGYEFIDFGLIITELRHFYHPQESKLRHEEWPRHDGYEIRPEIKL